MVGATPEWRGAARAVAAAPEGRRMTPRNRVSLILSAVLVVLGLTDDRAHRARPAGSGVAVGYVLRRRAHARRPRPRLARAADGEVRVMARKLPVLQRVVGEDALFAAIYGTISSSLYFALGVVALYALGLTPIVLPVVGLLVALAAGAYAEGATATGGGSPLIVRRAFGDVGGLHRRLGDPARPARRRAALGALRAALRRGRRRQHRPDERALGRADRRRRDRRRWALGRLLPQASRVDLVRPLALVDMLAQLTLAILGLTALGHIDVLTSSIDLGTAPTWTSLGYSLPIALVAFTGVEIVAGLLQEAANPARPLRRITIGAIAATVLAYVVIAAAALSLLPVHRAPGTPSGYASDLSTVWGTAPLAGAAAGDRRAGLRLDAPATSCACS